MNHIMFDLETIGSGSKAPIVQIAAVRFDEQGNVLAEFNSRIKFGADFNSFETDIDTIEWWISQSKRAQEIVFNPKGRNFLANALVELNVFLSVYKDKRLWSHATFDPPILMNAYKTLGLSTVIKHKEFMDIRTLNFLSGGNVREEIPARETFGEHHDAIADCKYQAAYVAAMMRKIRFTL